MKEINKGDVVIVMSNHELKENIKYMAGSSWRVQKDYTCVCGNEHIYVGYHTELDQKCICGVSLPGTEQYLPKGNFIHVDDKEIAIEQLGDDERALKFLKVETV